MKNIVTSVQSNLGRANKILVGDSPTVWGIVCTICALNKVENCKMFERLCEHFIYSQCNRESYILFIFAALCHRHFSYPFLAPG